MGGFIRYRRVRVWGFCYSSRLILYVFVNLDRISFVYIRFIGKNLKRFFRGRGLVGRDIFSFN